MSVAWRLRLGENPGTVKMTDIVEPTFLDATPLRRDADSVPADADTAAGPGPRSVLVVDDSRLVRTSLVRALSGRFPLQQADSGERAWELLLLDPAIGVVLSDLSMPGIDGFELLRRVRTSRLDRLRDLPFAVLSGADDPVQRNRARELGADRFALKGEAMDELANWLQSRLDDREPPRVSGAFATQADEPATIEDAVESGPQPAEITPDAPSTENCENWGQTPIPPIPQPLPDHDEGSENGVLTPICQVVSPVSDPRRDWFEAAVRPVNGADASPALLRLHAPGLVDLPARLRRGIRAADALYVDGADAAWLCVPASGSLAMRLALRFAMLAAGRAVSAGTAHARVSIDLHTVDPTDPVAALTALVDTAGCPLPESGLAVCAHEGSWGPAWQCTLPWAAVRLLIA